MIYTNSSNYGGKLKDRFKTELQNTNSLTIAVGYFGAETINKYQSKMLDVAKKGKVILLIGMVFHKGLRKKQYNALKGLNDKLMKINSQNGVFISMKEYHGKVYSFDDVIFLGSSNFSEEGLYERHECNTEISDNKTQTEVNNYLDFLLSSSWTKRFNEIDFDRKKTTPKFNLKSCVVKSIPKKAIQGSFDIKLRVNKQPASSLNLYFDKGRKNKNGLYAPRPWYEVEITTEKSDRDNPLYPKSVLKKATGNSRTGYFDAYIRVNSKIYLVKMSVGSDFGKALATSSGGRETLGRIIKGRLEEMNLLKFGDRITSQILEEYGRDSITLHKIDDKTYIIDF